MPRHQKSIQHLDNGLVYHDQDIVGDYQGFVAPLGGHDDRNYRRDLFEPETALERTDRVFRETVRHYGPRYNPLSLAAAQEWAATWRAARKEHRRYARP